MEKELCDLRVSITISLGYGVSAQLKLLRRLVRQGKERHRTQPLDFHGDCVDVRHTGTVFTGWLSFSSHHLINLSLDLNVVFSVTQIGTRHDLHLY